MEKQSSDTVEANDRVAFVAFYEQCGQEVLRALTVTLGDRELARDATQEAMTRAWRAWRDVSTYANPAGWTYRVGLNWARSRLRRVRRQVLGPVPDRVVEDRQPSDPALALALAELPQGHRAVLVLRVYLDWSVEEVARTLGIPEGTVRSRQHTALARLRQRLELEP